MKAPVDPKRILILDDDADFRGLIMIYLKSIFAGVEPVEYDLAAEGIPGKNFDWSGYDVLLLDYYLNVEGITGLDIFLANNKKESFPATLILTGTGNEEIAVRSLKAGIYDYLRKEHMGKKKLKDSILDAFTAHKAKQKKVSNQNRAFNKTLFYQQLEQAGNTSVKKRILLLLELDNHVQLEESLGLILRDNIVQYIAKQSFEIFQSSQYNPNTTRFSAATVALLIDDPGEQKILSDQLGALCQHLERRPYKFGGKEYSFTVSIGVLPLATAKGSVDEIIQQVRRACKMAFARKGNQVQTQRHTDSQASSDQQEAALLFSASKSILNQPPAAAQKKSATRVKPAAQKNDASLTTENLHKAAAKIKLAFEEQRVVPTFQPVISLSDTAEDDTHEIHSVSLQLFGSDGQIVEAEDVYAQTDIPALREYIDRWLIREAIRRIVNSEMLHTFVIKLGQESLEDASLFNWLRKLLAGLDEKAPGKSIALELKAQVFSDKEKQARALINYLSKAHGFRFTLSEFGKYNEINPLTGKAGFTWVRISHQQIRQLAKKRDKKSKKGSLLQQLQALGVRVIADQVEDATTLTEVISIGADYAQGNFIGEPTQQLGEFTNVESLEVV